MVTQLPYHTCLSCTSPFRNCADRAIDPVLPPFALFLPFSLRWLISRTTFTYNVLPTWSTRNVSKYPPDAGLRFKQARWCRTSNNVFQRLCSKISPSTSVWRTLIDNDQHLMVRSPRTTNWLFSHALVHPLPAAVDSVFKQLSHSLCWLAATQEPKMAARPILLWYINFHLSIQFHTILKSQARTRVFRAASRYHHVVWNIHSTSCKMNLSYSFHTLPNCTQIVTGLTWSTIISYNFIIKNILPV